MITEPQDSASMSRNELLTWINDTLKLNLTRIEQLGTGAVHCQLLDLVYPGKVPLHKVNWRAKFEYEFVYNFKILQQSFTKFNIGKYIDVERLIKARYNDNLEFAQWMRKFVQTNSNTWRDYDPIARRSNHETDFTFVEKATTVGAKPSVCKDSVTKAGAGLIAKPKSILAPRMTNLKNDSMYSQRSSEGGSMHGGSTSNLFTNLTPAENKVLTDLNNMIERQKADKNPQLEILRSERDFYYSKLRDIDHVLDMYKGNNVEALMNTIREVLYLTPEKIVIVCEDGDIKIKNKIEENDENTKENRNDEVPMGTMNEEKFERAGKTMKGDDFMVIEDVSLEEIKHEEGMNEEPQGQTQQGQTLEQGPEQTDSLIQAPEHNMSCA